MSDFFSLLEEPLLSFGEGQLAEDPHDGLALFGASEQRAELPPNVVIGTSRGVELWAHWMEALNSPASCLDVSRQRPWPPYPGLDVAFGAPWPDPAKRYQINDGALSGAARRVDRYERAFCVANLYLEPLRQVIKLDARPGVAICIVPDEVYENCRPKSYVKDAVDIPKTEAQREFLREALKDRRKGQSRMFDDSDPDYYDVSQNLEKYGLSPDFRRQLKARVMQFDVPVQIVRESTLRISEQVRKGEKGTNPLSDRLWNFATALFYKSGFKPWKTPWARDGVCYVGLAYRQSERRKGTACCAAQMFLDSGDGIVFVGEFGPWYSEERNEFHLPAADAEKLLAGTIETYRKQDGRPLKEIFLHARSGIDELEFQGFKRACPSGVNLVAVRVRQERSGPRLYRHDDHPDVTRRGMHPVLRGIFWQRTKRFGLLFTTGFKPRIATYDGWEVPVPLSISVQHGDADVTQVARDVLGLTKLNYNACQLGESQPITVKYSDRVGEILLANPDVPREYWRHNFKYYT